MKEKVEKKKKKEKKKKGSARAHATWLTVNSST